MRQTLTHQKEKTLDFPMPGRQNLRFQWSLDKQNETMNQYNREFNEFA